MGGFYKFAAELRGREWGASNARPANKYLLVKLAVSVTAAAGSMRERRVMIIEMIRSGRDFFLLTLFRGRDVIGKFVSRTIKVKFYKGFQYGLQSVVSQT